MVKENRTKKLVSRCVTAAFAFIITMACAADAAHSSDPVTAAQVTEASQTSGDTEVKVTEATDETVAFKVAKFEASQGASTSSVFKSTQSVASAKVTSAQTSKTEAKTTAATAATAETKAVTTTKSAAATKSVTAKTTSPQVIYFYPPETTKAAVTTKETAKTTASAQKASAKTAVPTMLPEKTYDTDYTHPYKAQTNKITVHWEAVQGAVKYLVYVKGGQYSNWTNVASTTATAYTVSELNRETSYYFAVKSLDENGKASELSNQVNIRTARMDYSLEGWQAMCRIVYHEVGGAAGALWDKPIVYVADCVTNQFVCAKYTLKGVWPAYYKKYPDVESMIYKSTGFASEKVLTARGATYPKVTERVKMAVWGATYGVTYYNNIANDYNVFFWNSTKKATTNSKIAYSFKTPWNYVNIWRQYWA